MAKGFKNPEKLYKLFTKMFTFEKYRDTIKQIEKNSAKEMDDDFYDIDYDNVFPQVACYMSNGICREIEEYYREENKDVTASLADILGLYYYVEFKNSKKIDLLSAESEDNFVTIYKISKKLKKSAMFSIEIENDD